MSNIQNIDVSLHEIVKNISKNSYLIPKFQRDFVWNNNDIVDLGDSIIRGYPISSLLIMAENGSLNVSSHSLVKEILLDKQDEPLEEELRFYVLDGQQRLTSISKLFLNLDIKNEYYFDLLSILLAKYPNDEIQKDDGVVKVWHKSKTTDIFCRSFPRSKDDSDKPTRQNNRFISGRSIIENRFGSVVNKFLREFKDRSEEDLDKYTDYLNAIFGSVGGYSIPATVIARDSELGIVIRVFEKVNSSGKKLTLFDLINAKSFQTQKAEYQVGLTDYLTKNILERVSSDISSSAAIKSFLRFNDQNRSFEKLDKIVRILEIHSLLKKNATPAIFQSTMLEKDPNFWFDNWNKNADLFIKIVLWLKKEGLVDIGQTTFLEYMIAVFLANPKAFEISSFSEKIKSYAFYLSLSGTPFNKSNLDTVEKIFSISQRTVDKLPPYDDLTYTLNISDKDILQITPSSSKFTAIINAFYIDKIRGKFTHDIMGNSIKSDDVDDLDKHHIFPKSKVSDYSAKSPFNSIANYVLLGNFDNREVIKDRSPKEYAKNLILNKDSGAFNCHQNLIDPSQLENVETEDEANVLLKSRAKNIADLLNTVFKTDI